MSKVLDMLNRIQSEVAAAPRSELRSETQGKEKFGLPSLKVSFAGYYRLKGNPFADAINPEYYFKTSSQLSASRKMFASAQEGISLGMVTGPSGTGKTMITQLLLQTLDSAIYRVVLVLVTPKMGKTVLLKEILRECGVEGLPSRTKDLLDLLHRTVLDLHTEGKRLVVLIDEAHFLSAEALHMLRTISNLETPTRKLCTVLLFAEDSFLRRLRHPSYRSLHSRMFHRAVLERMTEEETAQYVNYRLMVAGAERGFFDEAALRALHDRSGGVCREVSRLSYLALLEGASRECRLIDADLVKGL